MKHALILLLVSPMFAASYFVAKTGSDSNPGTSTLPWLTIQHAANTAGAGDTINVGCGTYNEDPSLPHAGTSRNPITFQSQRQYCAVIQGQSGAANIITINGAYNTVQFFEIIGASDGGNSTGIKCNSGDGCKIVGNEIHHIGTTSSSYPMGAAIEPNNGNWQVIDRNLIYDVSPPRTAARCNHEQGIYSSTATTSNANGTITNNLILLCYQCYGIQFDGGLPSGWNVSNNTFDNVGQGAPNNSGGGIYFNCAISGATCDNNKFNNNIFRNVGGDSCITEATVAPGGTNGTHNVYQNDLFSNCFGKNNFIHGTLTGMINANPRFISDTGDQTGDYHPRAGSPAINAGVSSGEPATDFDGLVRTGEVWIGAYHSTPELPGKQRPLRWLHWHPSNSSLEQLQAFCLDGMNNLRQMRRDNGTFPLTDLFRIRNKTRTFIREMAICVRVLAMDTSDRKPYTPPEQKKLTPDQAKLLLLGYASAGDEDAKELLELFYPEASVKT